MTNYEYLDNLIQNLEANTNKTAEELEKFLKDMSEDDRHTAVGKRALALHEELAKFLIDINKI